ncbi:MAG: tungstate transporter permease, partial [Oscillospiraceae bacterium]|nr:tungstate transporter permease [Oscillospiraceae bacterium]
MNAIYDERGDEMQSALEKAVELIFTADAELCNILLVTAKMSLCSSMIALLIGLPIGIWLGSCRFRGRGTLLVVNRTLMGLPPVVCGLLFYMLFSGIGQLRHLKLLLTVNIMAIAQVYMIAPIVVGN